MEGLAVGHKAFLGLLSGRVRLLEKAGGAKMLAFGCPVNLSKIFFFITSRHSSVKATQLRLQILEFI